MTLSQYQRLAALWDDGNDNITQLALIVCDLYGFTYERVDNMSKWEFLRYVYKVNRQFTNILKRPFWAREKFEINANKITLGQFIEIQYFLSNGEMDNLHLIGASIWKDKREHQTKAELLRNKKVRYVLQPIKDFLISFFSLIDSYKNLFETEAEEVETEEKPHPFISQYGWIYAATQVADHEKITLEQAYDLPIIQALNDLAYLKSYAAYQKKINQ